MLEVRAIVTDLVRLYDRQGREQTGYLGLTGEFRCLCWHRR
jgi:hypothetical protein